MRQNDIAHGLFVTRGDQFTHSNGEFPASVIRILLWPRTKVLGEYIQLGCSLSQILLQVHKKAHCYAGLPWTCLPWQSSFTIDF